MALSAAAGRVAPSQHGPKCGFGVILRALPDDDRAFYEHMRDGGESLAHMARVFREDGHKVNAEQIRRHQAGECSCPSDKPQR